MSTPIRENPSIRNLHNQLATWEQLLPWQRALRLLGVRGRAVAEALDQLRGMASQVRETTELVERFNALFRPRGWIVFEGLDTVVMRRAVELAESGAVEAGDGVLIEYFDRDTIEVGLLRLRQIAVARQREPLLRLALEDHCAGRYHASVPVVLAQLDGIVQDLTGASFYGAKVSRDDRQRRFAHLVAKDTVAGHPQGLAALARSLSVGRPATTVESLDLPYRHGILHGRDLQYATRRLSAQSFALLLALQPWAVKVEAGQQQVESPLVWPDPDDISWASARRRLRAVRDALREAPTLQGRTYRFFVASDPISLRGAGDLTVDGVTAALAPYDFRCHGPTRDRAMLRWDYTWSSGIASYHVAIWSHDGTAIGAVQGTLVHDGTMLSTTELATDFLGFLAAILSPEAERMPIRRWMEEHVDQGGRLVAGGAHLTLTGCGRWRVLDICFNDT